MPSQVWPLRSHPQGDPDRVPIHQPCQGKEEQTNGHGSVRLNPQPQQLLHQLRQLGGIVSWGQAQPQRAGKWLFLTDCAAAVHFCRDPALLSGRVGVLFQQLHWGSCSFAVNEMRGAECGILLPTLQTGLPPWT